MKLRISVQEHLKKKGPRIEKKDNMSMTYIF